MHFHIVLVKVDILLWSSCRWNVCFQYGLMMSKCRGRKCSYKWMQIAPMQIAMMQNPPSFCKNRANSNEIALSLLFLSQQGPILFGFLLAKSQWLRNALPIKAQFAHYYLLACQHIRLAHSKELPFFVLPLLRNEFAKPLKGAQTLPLTFLTSNIKVFYGGTRFSLRVSLPV